MHFEIIGTIRDVETIARGSGIRELARLRKFHGTGNWRKRKGVATVRLADGQSLLAERCNGTKPRASESSSSKSSASWDNRHGKAQIRRLRIKHRLQGVP